MDKMAKSDIRKTVSATAPAKLILSGEHAVVYDAPALGMMLNIRTTVRLSFTGDQFILFKLKNFHTELKFDGSTIQEFKETIDHRYAEFLKNNLPADKILNPTELVAYGVALYADQYNIIPTGICIEVASDIPTGLGLGSSASCIVSLLRVLSHAFLPIESDETFIQLAQQIENLAHGKSSGFDIKLVFYESNLYCEKNHCTPYSFPDFPFTLTHTGIPCVSTADCIAAAAEVFRRDKTLLPQFFEVTQSLAAAIKKDNLADIKQCIAKNHQLLCELGVVPVKVQNYILEIEKRGNAAKICGAGASSGDAGGIVLVVGEHPISDILTNYDYKILGVTITQTT